MLAVAEGGVRTIAKNLMRAHELGTQAGNDTYSYAERRLIRQEIAAIWKEIDRVAQSTTFNGIEMLTLSAPKKLLIQVGSGNDTSTGSVDVLNIASAFGALTNFTLHLGTAGVPNNAAANAATKNWSLTAPSNKIKAAATALTPALSPSMLSRKLMALLIPASHKKVSA